MQERMASKNQPSVSFVTRMRNSARLARCDPPSQRVFPTAPTAIDVPKCEQMYIPWTNNSTRSSAVPFIYPQFHYLPPRHQDPPDSSYMDARKAISFPLNHRKLLEYLKPSKSTLVDNEKSLKSFLALLQRIPKCGLEKSIPDIFLDCEGHDLPKTLSTVQIHFSSVGEIYILDVTTLGAKVFDTVSDGIDGVSFRQMLEDAAIPIIIFGLGCDARAMFRHHKIFLRATIDLQQLELEASMGPKHKSRGLPRCIEDSKTIPPELKAKWLRNKNTGIAHCSGRSGYAVFDKRPLANVLITYATGDVELLPYLFTEYSTDVCNDRARMQRVIDASAGIVSEGISVELRSIPPPLSARIPKPAGPPQLFNSKDTRQSPCKDPHGMDIILDT